MVEKIKVFLIEDDPDDAALIKRMLGKIEKPNFIFKHTQNLSDGLKQLKNENFDVLLLDLVLPESMGLNTFRRTHDQFNKKPIIILTGLSDEDLGVKAVREGAQDYLVKGEFDRQLLARSIEYSIERKHFEEALRESEERYRNIVESAQVGIWVIDGENKTSYINNRMAEMLDYPIKEMLGRNLLDFLDQEGQQSIKKHLETLKQGKREIFELKFLRKDDKELWTLLSTSPIFNSKDEYKGVIGIITDITTRKGVEKALLEREEHLCLLSANIMDVINYIILKESWDAPPYQSDFSQSS